jgi:hypothetical protein
MSHKTTASVAHTIGIDTGKNTLHLIGLDAPIGRSTLSPRRSEPSLHEPCAPAACAREYLNPLRGPGASIVSCDHSKPSGLKPASKLSDHHLIRKVMTAHRLRYMFRRLWKKLVA